MIGRTTSLFEIITIAVIVGHCSAGKDLEHIPSPDMTLLNDRPGHLANGLSSGHGTVGKTNGNAPTNELRTTYVETLDRNVQTAPERYPLLPVGKGSVPTNSLFALHFRERPVSQLLDFYSEIAGVEVVMGTETSAIINYVSDQQWSYDQALRIIRQLLADQGLFIEPLDSKRVRVYRKE